MFKFSETNHVHKIFIPTASTLLMIYGEVGQGVKLLRGGGKGKKAGSGNILWWNMTWTGGGGGGAINAVKGERKKLNFRFKIEGKLKQMFRFQYSRFQGKKNMPILF